jgi:broad specificity phosphatase PhoE
MQCYFLRHGEIKSNLRRIYAGRNEEKLTLRGRQQAKEAALKLRDFRIDTVYSSPLPRAIETAEIIGVCICKKPIIEDSFNELVLGPWESKTEEEIARNFPKEWAIWNTRPADFVLKGRETLRDLLQRVLKGIEKIRVNNRGKNVVVVTHVSVIRVLLIQTRKLDLNIYKTLEIPHGKIFPLSGH